MAKHRHNQRNSGHGGGMGSVIGIAALGIGAYFLYEWFMSSASAASASNVPAVPVSTVPTSTSGNIAVVPTSSTSNIVNTPVASPTTPTVVIPVQTVTHIDTAPNILADALSKTAGNPGTLTADQWSYYYQQMRGVTISPDQYAIIMGNLNTLYPGNSITGQSVMTVDEFVAGLSSVGLTGLGRVTTQKLNPVVGNQATVQNAPYGASPAPGRPFRERNPVFGTPMGMPVILGNQGMGRTYLSGYAGHSAPMSGLGVLGQGYGINETTYGGATAYELATKYVM